MFVDFYSMAHSPGSLANFVAVGEFQTSKIFELDGVGWYVFWKGWKTSSPVLGEVELGCQKMLELPQNLHPWLEWVYQHLLRGIISAFSRRQTTSQFLSCLCALTSASVIPSFHSILASRPVPRWAELIFEELTLSNGVKTTHSTVAPRAGVLLSR